MNLLKDLGNFQNSPGVQKIFKGMAYLSSEKLLKLLIGIVIHSLIARKLGPEIFGEVNYAVNTVFIFSLFVLLGMDEVLIKDLVSEKDQAEKEKSIAAGLVLRILAVVISVCIFFPLLIFNIFSEESQVNTYLLIFSFVLFLQPILIFEIPFLSEVKSKVIFKARMSGYVAGTFSKIIFLSMSLKPVFLVFTYMIEEVIGKFVLVWNFSKEYRFSKLTFSKTKTLKILKSSYPIMLMTFVLAVDSRLGFQYMRLVNDDAALGFFAISFNLIDAWNFLPIAITTSVFPKLIETKRDISEVYMRRTLYLFSFCFWVSVLLIVSTYVVAPFIISFLYGAQYAGAEYYLRLMSLLLIPMFLNSARTKYFVIEEKALKWFLLNLCVTLLSVTFIFSYPSVNFNLIIGTILASHVVVNTIFSIFDSDVRLTVKMMLHGVYLPIQLLIKKPQDYKI